MKDSRKKRRELFWVNRLRELSGLSFMVDDLRENQERPDYLIRYEDKTIGLEVVELQIDRKRCGSHGSFLQKETMLRQQVISRTSKLYFANASQPINVDIYFHPAPAQSLQTINRVQLAERICDALHQLNLATSDRRRLDSYTVPAAPMPVSFMDVSGIPESITPHWHVINPGWSKELETSDLEPILNAKNALISEYRKTVQENWLLIVADGRTPPGMFRLPEDGLPDLPKSNFERTYFLCEPGRFFFEWP